MPYIILRGRWYDSLLNVYAPIEDKIDDMKDRFYKELEHVFDTFSKYQQNILLGDFNAKVRREDIFKQTIGNQSLNEISNDNGVIVVNFATAKNLIVKSTMFPHCNIHQVALGQVFSEYFGFPCQSSFPQLLHNHPHLPFGACTIGQKWPQYLVDLVPPNKKKKHTWTSPDGKTHYQFDHILIDRRRHSSILDVRSLRVADCDTTVWW
jgi:hypothetical protein